MQIGPSLLGGDRRRDASCLSHVHVGLDVRHLVRACPDLSRDVPGLARDDVTPTLGERSRLIASVMRRRMTPSAAGRRRHGSNAPVSQAQAEFVN